MFSNSRTFFAAAAIALFGAGIGAGQLLGSAEAQSSGNAPVILTVNQARLIGNSTAGGTISGQMDTLQQQANAELEAVVNQLVAEAKDLESKRETIGEEEFTKQARELAIRQQNIPVLREIKVRELSLSEQKAISDISKATQPILQNIVDSRGATLLLERADVLYAAKETDITQEALNKLNETMTSVTVEKVTLTRKQAEDAAAE